MKIVTCTPFLISFLFLFHVDAFDQRTYPFGGKLMLEKFDGELEWLKIHNRLDGSHHAFPIHFIEHSRTYPPNYPDSYRNNHERFFHFGCDIFLKGFSNSFGLSPIIPTGVREDWFRVYEAHLPSYDVATDMAVDDGGNIYVTGYTTNLPNGLDIHTIKYDSDGNQIWSQYFDGEGHGDDMAFQIAVDDSGNVYVCGTSSGLNTDFIILKYDSYGDELWTMRYGLSLYDVVVDTHGFINVIGHLSDRLKILKYNNHGQQI